MAISLTAYTIVSTTLAGAFAVAAFSRTMERPKFKEIDVERINIVESDGRMRMTLSNAEQSPGWVHKGKLIPGRPKNAGMIFYNDEGEEDGGLLFAGKKVSDSVTSWGHLSFDQYDQDQDISIDLNEEHGKRGESLRFLDRPNTSLWDQVAKAQALDSTMPAGPARDSAKAAVFGGVAQRVYVGRSEDKVAMVRLSDGSGHPRLRLTVDSAGAANIEFLDAAGKVTRKISGTE
jgi:hypothetical protein